MRFAVLAIPVTNQYAKISKSSGEHLRGIRSKTSPALQQSSREQPFTHVAPCSGIRASSW